MIKVHLRWLNTQQDLDHIEEAEDCTNDPWTLDEIVEAHRDQHTLVKAITLPHPEAPSKELFLGHLIYRLEKDSQSIDLERIVVLPWFQRSGVGSGAISPFIQRIQTRTDRKAIIAKVSERDVDSQMFLKACGLECVHTMERWYSPSEDGYVFEYRKDMPIPEVMQTSEPPKKIKVFL